MCAACPIEWCSGKVQFEFVDVAPTPGLAGLERLHDRVFGAVEVLGGMFVFRGVAATDMAALQAQPQVHPGVTHLQALLAALGVRCDLLDLVQMLAGFHGYPLSRRMASVNEIARPLETGQIGHSMILVFGKLLPSSTRNPH